MRFLCFLLIAFTGPLASATNVIFVHPDGAGISHWQAARFYWAGPDADLHWDRIPHIAVYRGHMADSLSATSNGGGTTHAYGVKVGSGAFGTDGKNPGRPRSASGKKQSLMHEAMKAGIRTGLVNSGSLVEPGTACFVTSVPFRDEEAEISKQVIESGVDVILGGGEEWLLPREKSGRHAAKGRREDGLDLVETARSLGYHVVFDRKELLEVPDGTKKLLGVFAAQSTFNDMPEEAMKKKELPTFAPGAPTIAEMTSAALKLLDGDRFFLVVEEEGIDNFANYNNAQGALDALKRADDALGIGLDFVEKNKDTLLVTTADSSAGAMDVYGFPQVPAKMLKALEGRDVNGAPYGLAEKGQAFLAKPDKSGQRLPFVLVWGTVNDASGGILVRAAGKNAEKVRGNFDNTRVYELMRESMFGKR
jgi:alkaline phosphatase